MRKCDGEGALEDEGVGVGEDVGLVEFVLVVAVFSVKEFEQQEESEPQQ
jgi:hypothetical protein